MRTLLTPQMLSSLLLFIDTGVTRINSQVPVASTIGHNPVPMTMPGILSTQNTVDFLLQGQPDAPAEGHPIASPIIHSNASADDHSIADIVVPTFSAVESTGSVVEKVSNASSDTFTNATHGLGFIVPSANQEENRDEASNTTIHLGAGPAPWIGAPSNGSEPLGPSDDWSNNGTTTLPNTTHSGHEEPDRSRTVSAAAVISTKWLQKISGGYETGLKKKAQLKDLGLGTKKTVSGKMLALFLAVAGAIVCLLLLIYFIYSRTHKSEMFSHHRLYGEGFEDPVLHLDTPMDHYDFFSFSDTHEHSPCTLQQLRKVSGEAPPPPSTPAGPVSQEHQQEVIQLESLAAWARNKNFV